MIAVIDGYCTFVGPDYLMTPYLTAHEKVNVTDVMFPDGSLHQIYEGDHMNEDPTDLIASVVYDVLIAEGILGKYTLDDAIVELVENVRDKAASCSNGGYDNLLHASVKDLVKCICPAVEECFDASC